MLIMCGGMAHCVQSTRPHAVQVQAFCMIRTFVLWADIFTLILPRTELVVISQRACVASLAGSGLTLCTVRRGRVHALKHSCGTSSALLCAHVGYCGVASAAGYC